MAKSTKIGWLCWSD